MEKLGNFGEAVVAYRLLAEASDEHRLPARNRISQIEEQYLNINKEGLDATVITFFEDLEKSTRVKVDYVFNQMNQWMQLAESVGGEAYLRNAADLGLYIMTHGFRIAFQPDEISLFRAADIKGGISSNHPGRYILVDQKQNPHKMYPMNNADPIQAELENVTLTWFGWYRLYREVLGTLLEVGRHDEVKVQY